MNDIQKKIKNNNDDFLVSIANKTEEEIFSNFVTSKNGLTEENYKNNCANYGTNVLHTKKNTNVFKVLLNATITPFNMLMLAMALLNIVIPNQQNWIAFGVIIGNIVASIVITFFEQYRSGIASDKLQAMIEVTCSVTRNGTTSEINMNELTVGDIVNLSAGDIVPADIRIISSNNLFVDQSAMTGESESVDKHVILKENENKNPLSCDNLIFMGTSVSSGTAIGVVIAVAQKTFFGKLLLTINKHKVTTEFDRGIEKISWLLIVTTLILSATITLIQLFINIEAWTSALIYGFAVIVGLTPEMLPLIIAMNLSKQAKTLIKKKIIVKNLGSIQNFGAIDVFCTDKTGTITMNKIILEKHIDVFGKNSDNVLFYAYLNSYFQTGYKNLIDEAIISKVAKNMSDDIGTYSYYKEIPYDFNRRRMSVIINRNNKERMMITKGSVKEMLSICTNVLIKGNEEKITKEMLNEIENQTKELNAQGMRTIAVAICNEQNKLSGNLSIATENELTLIGFLGLLDPPKDSATNAIKALKDSGVDVKIITGDDAEVAKSICKTVGINNIESIDGNEIANMSDEELTNKVLSIGIFAKVSPEQKKQIIKCIRKNNRVVGYMGDGINDVAAMKEADISISVNTATDIAKETSDIILLEGDLNVLENGVLEGRKTYVNIMKYIKITIFSMFGNIISLLVASIWFGSYGTPILPTQLLILNIISDLAFFVIPWDDIDQETIKKPRRWDIKSITKFMIYFGILSTLFDVSIFSVLLYAVDWGIKDGEITLAFQTTWFFLSILTQLTTIIVFRTEKIPIIQSRPSTIVVSTVSAIFIAVLLLCIVGVPSTIEQIFSGQYAVIIFYVFAILLAYILVMQFAKYIYIKIFKSWL